MMMMMMMIMSMILRRQTGIARGDVGIADDKDNFHTSEFTYINNGKITQRDITVTNGAVHILDTVLRPPS